MPQYADVRQEKAAAAGARWTAAAERHRAREAKARAKGNARQAEMAAKAAADAERHARTNAGKVEVLTLPAARARVARRLNEASASDILERPTRLAAETPHPSPIPTTGDRRLARQAEKRAQQEQQAFAAEETRRRRAGVDHDARTAAAQREIVVAKRKGADPREAPAVASLADVASLIRNRSERTIERIRAMERFDELAHRALAGLFPSPRFERGVDCSRLPGVPDSRADASAEMQRLTARIGDEAQAILFHRVFERRTFTWMRDAGMGDERALTALFLSAVDGVGRFYGLRPQSKAVEAMEQRLSA